jgi:cytochrome P450
MRALRIECPVGHSTRHGGFYVLTRAGDVRAAARHPELFSSQANPGPGPGFPFSSGDRILSPMIGTDPPLHRDFRQPLQKKFSPSSAEAMAPHIREIITALIDEFIESGAADFARQLTIPLPSLVTGELLDLPADRRVEFQQWAMQLVAEGASSEGYRKLSVTTPSAPASTGASGRTWPRWNSESSWRRYYGGCPTTWSRTTRSNATGAEPGHVTAARDFHAGQAREQPRLT